MGSFVVGMMTCARRDDPEHSRLLLWQSAGRLGQDEARALDAHLAGCAACREEVDALRSVGECLRGPSVPGTDPHFEIERLLAYEAGASSQDPGLLALVEKHLDRCSSCRDEVEALRTARRIFPAPPEEHDEARSIRRPARPRWTGRLWAGAGIAAAIAAVAILIPLLRTQEQALTEVTLTPVERGVDNAQVLTGAGPWSVVVELPFEGPDGEYAVGLVAASESGAPAIRRDLPPVSSRVGRLRFQVPALPADRYVMQVKSVGRQETAVFEYRFRVLAQPATGNVPDKGSS